MATRYAVLLALLKHQPVSHNLKSLLMVNDLNRVDKVLRRECGIIYPS